MIMNKAAKAIKIAEILETLYPNPDIPLNHSNNDTLLIAVLFCLRDALMFVSI